MTADELFQVIEEQAEEGVDFVTVHCGVNMAALDRLRAEGRITDIVSRGGSFMACWIVANQAENPLYEQYDRLLEIARKHDVTLSLGDGLRPGCLADATDRAQIQELITLGELTQRAWDAGVQVMNRRPGPCAPGSGGNQHQAAKKALPQRAVLCSGASGHRHRRRARPCGLRHRRGSGRLGRGGFPLLRYPHRAPGPAPVRTTCTREWW